MSCIELNMKAKISACPIHPLVQRADALVDKYVEDHTRRRVHTRMALDTAAPIHDNVHGRVLPIQK